MPPLPQPKYPQYPPMTPGIREIHKSEQARDVQKVEAGEIRDTIITTPDYGTSYKVPHLGDNES